MSDKRLRSTGRRILVTGGSRGIGRAVASQLIERGDRVAVVGRDERALGQLAKTAPDQVVVIVGDLTDEVARDSMIRVLKDPDGPFGGQLDHAMLCAGMARHEPFMDMTEVALRATFELNFFAPALLSTALAGIVTEGGSITFVSSTLATRPAPGTSSYAASKAALESLTRSMAIELAPHIRVNAVAPGLVDTAMARQLRLAAGEPFPKGQALRDAVAKQLEQMDKLHPLKRIGQPGEVAKVLLEMMDSSWCTGSVWTLDGGLTL